MTIPSPLLCMTITRMVRGSQTSTRQIVKGAATDASLAEALRRVLYYAGPGFDRSIFKVEAYPADGSHDFGFEETFEWSPQSEDLEERMKGAYRDLQERWNLCYRRLA